MLFSDCLFTRCFLFDHFAFEDSYIGQFRMFQTKLITKESMEDYKNTLCRISSFIYGNL